MSRFRSPMPWGFRAEPDDEKYVPIGQPSIEIPVEPVYPRETEPHPNQYRYRNFNRRQARRLQDALPQAREWAALAVSRMRAVSAGAGSVAERARQWNDQAYRCFFGTWNRRRSRIVFRRWTRIQRILYGPLLRFRIVESWVARSPLETRIARATPGTRRIRMIPRLLDAHEFPDADLVRIIVHECAHLAYARARGPEIYEPDEIYDLARADPETAIDMAEAYSLFGFQAFMARDFVGEFRPPCKH